MLRVSGRHWAEGDTQATWGGLPLSAPLWEPSLRTQPSLPVPLRYHEGHPTPPQRVRQQLGELAVPEGDVVLLPLWVQQQGDAVTWVGKARLPFMSKATQLVLCRARISTQACRSLRYLFPRDLITRSDWLLPPDWAPSLIPRAHRRAWHLAGAQEMSDK